MNDTSQDSQTEHVECPPTREPAVRAFIFAALLMGMGAWCLTDLRKPPEAWDFKHINEVASYLLNNWGPVVFFPAGLLVAALAVRFLRRKLLADAEGIGYAGADKVAWDQVHELDASKLKDKQILLLRYGQGRKLTLDAWKLQNFRELVAFVEAHVPEGVKMTK